jgi:hypothetical protein
MIAIILCYKRDESAHKITCNCRYQCIHDENSLDEVIKLKSAKSFEKKKVVEVCKEREPTRYPGLLVAR